MSLKDETQRILDDAVEIARVAREITDPREPDDEPIEVETGAQAWDRQTANQVAFLNRERHRA